MGCEGKNEAKNEAKRDVERITKHVTIRLMVCQGYIRNKKVK